MGDLTFSGIDAFKRDLDRLNFADKLDVLTEAALEAVEPWRARASELAPRRTGRLSKQIIKQKAKDSDPNQVTVEVGVTSKAFYGAFQEFGTAHHPKQPFFEPAREQTISDMEDGFADALNKQIAKALPRTT